MSWSGKIFFAGVLMFLIYTIAMGYGGKWAKLLSAPATSGTS